MVMPTTALKYSKGSIGVSLDVEMKKYLMA
jgi:hypothetical protein